MCINLSALLLQIATEDKCLCHLEKARDLKLAIFIIVDFFFFLLFDLF